MSRFLCFLMASCLLIPLMPTRSVFAQDSQEVSVELREEIKSLIEAWNAARNEGDPAAVAAFYRPTDQESAKSLSSTKKSTAKVSIKDISKLSDTRVRVRFQRSWTGPSSGSARIAMSAELVDGRWMLVMQKPSTNDLANAILKPAQEQETSVQVGGGGSPLVDAVPAAPVATKSPVRVVQVAGQTSSLKTSADSAATVPRTKSENQGNLSEQKAGAAQESPKQVRQESVEVATLPSKTQLVRQSRVVQDSRPAPVPVQEVASFPETVSASVGRVTLMKLPAPVRRVAVGDPNVADFTMVSPTELYILGKSVGTTNLLLWDAKGETHSLEAIVSVNLSPLQDSLTRSLPRETDIQISAASGSVVLSGSIADTVAADAAINLADAYIQNLNRYLRTVASSTGAAGGAGGAGASGPSAMRVINLMRIRDPQQVMLEVRIAEVSKDLLEKLGLNFTSLAKGQVDQAVLGDRSPLTVTGGITSRVISASPATGALSYLLTGKWSGSVEINAQKDDGLVKILAEPTLVAMSGKEGSFLSGGSVYIPVPTVSGSSPTLEPTEFGIRLKFLPTVLDNGRISLQVSPEVSEPILVNGQTGFSIRRVSSTVQMREGETLVIGGLIKDNLTESIKAFPLLGEIPILGALFRSTEFRNNKSELLVVVSPTLVRASTTMPALPTDSFVPPSRSELFLGGKLEGSGPPPVRGEEKNAPR